MTTHPVLGGWASVQAFRSIRAATKGGSLPPPLEPPAPKELCARSKEFRRGWNSSLVLSRSECCVTR